MGWDRSKFGGSGGWLIRNSWGQGWPDYSVSDRPDFWFDRIDGLGGYAYIPVNKNDWRSVFIDQIWTERFILYTGGSVTEY